MPAVTGTHAGQGIRGVVRRQHRADLSVRGRRGVVRAHPDDRHPLGRVDLDGGVDPHADVPAGQPARGADGQRGTGGRASRGVGRSGDHPLPRRHRGRRQLRRRHGRRVGRRRVHRVRRDRPRHRRCPCRRRALAAARGSRGRDAHPRQPDQGVPRRRSGSNRRGDRAGRRRDGGVDDDQGERRDRAAARPTEGARRGQAPDRDPRPCPRRDRAGVQPGCGGCRPRSGADRVGDGDRIGCVRVGRPRTVHGLPRLAVVPAADDRPRARPSQTVGRGVRADAPPRGRRTRPQHRPSEAPPRGCQRRARAADRRAARPHPAAASRRDRLLCAPRRRCWRARRVDLDRARPVRGGHRARSAPARAHCSGRSSGSSRPSGVQARCAGTAS